MLWNQSFLQEEQQG
jgi:hypothetical protein